MKRIELFEKVLAKEIEYTREINYAVFNAYKNSKRNNQELLDFSECIWEKDYEPIIKFCKENDIEEFTISSTFSGLLETLDGFEHLGCELVGLTKVNYVRWQDEIEKIPAMKIRIPR